MLVVGFVVDPLFAFTVPLSVTPAAASDEPLVTTLGAPGVVKCKVDPWTVVEVL